MDEINAFLDKLHITLDTEIKWGEVSVSVGELLLAPLVLLLGFLVVRRLAVHLRTQLIRRDVDANLIQLIIRAFNIVAMIVVALTALEVMNVPLTAFAFISGAVAIGIGFGAQTIINNFISGWILMWERPIRIGDFLEVADARGRVEAIDARSTRIRRTDGVHLLIPNSHLLENTVVNWTLVDNLARSEVKVGVAYGSPVKRVAELFQEIMEAHPEVLADPEPVVFFEDFGDSALLFGGYFWVNAITERDLRKIRSDLRFAIDEVFNDNDIVIAFPQRDVHLQGALTLHQPEQREETS
ncbi:MAG: mechanosensitive ion channel [Immundisolibacteraceae bacterium]|nr:mechanosensitive ion channel [Immundisolibacteraceae bacterium]